MEELKLAITELLQELESERLAADTGGLGLLVFIMQALALYTIAQRRGIDRPWLAWIPLVNVWILGAISDQYQKAVNGQQKNKSNILLGLSIAIAVLTFLVAIIAVVLTWNILRTAIFCLDAGVKLSDPAIVQLLMDNLHILLILSLLALPIGVLAIILAVFYLMALYDVYRSCDPKNCAWYFVLSLVGNVVVEGARCIFLILCKDKDLGMQPQNEEPIIEN